MSSGHDTDLGSLSGRWRTAGQEEVQPVNTNSQAQGHKTGSNFGKVKEASKCCFTMQGQGRSLRVCSV